MAREKDISNQIKESKKVLTQREYIRWLQTKLNQHGIDRTRLIATVVVVERSLGSELNRTGSRRERPFYRLYNEDGTITRAWVHAAELVLWLKYNGFKADPFVKAITRHPFVRKFIANKEKKKQIPLNVLFPSARIDTTKLRDYSRHFKQWQVKH